MHFQWSVSERPSPGSGQPWIDTETFRFAQLYLKWNFLIKGTVVCIQGYSVKYKLRRGGQRVGLDPGMPLSIHTLQVLLTEWRYRDRVLGGLLAH